MNTYRNYNDLPLMLSVPEVAKVLGISRAGAYQLVRSAGFPHMKIGNRIVVPRDKFIAWIDQQSEVSDREDTSHLPRITSGYTTKCLT